MNPSTNFGACPSLGNQLAKGTRTMIRNLLVAFTLLVLFGCASMEDKIQEVHKGATKNQVIVLLGQPDSSQLSGDYEALLYANRPVNDAATERADYIVILLEKQVIDFGYGYVRQGDSSVTNRLFLMPYNKEPPSIPTRN
jgi:hypothetical protein